MQVCYPGLVLKFPDFTNYKLVTTNFIIPELGGKIPSSVSIDQYSISSIDERFADNQVFIRS